MRRTKTARALIEAAERLADEVDALRFSPPVTHVYNPLRYARRAHDAYVERYGRARKQVVFLGMNPGPFGMAQSGVPFGAVPLVKRWLKIEAEVGKPDHEHEKRPILGYGCARVEVSGERLWGFFEEEFGTADRFFERHYVANYCPLVFMEDTGRNRTPDKLPKAERVALYEACDRHLHALIEALEPEHVIGIGKFAESRARAALQDTRIAVASVLHPSPASPRANQGWARAAREELTVLGVCER